jgi:hypothetical protein
MLKMQSWIEKNCPNEKPEIWIWNFDGRPRSEEFVRRIPFVKFGGYLNESVEIDKRKLHQSYHKGSWSEAFNFHGFDCYLCVNGELRVGQKMDNILSKYKTNWDYPINLKGIPSSKIKEPYIIFYFSDHGMFRKWVEHMPVETIQHFLSTIKGYRLILTGSEWDFPFNEKIKGDNIENMCGETSLDDLLSLIVHANAFVGWCGGNTIISPHLGTPTLMLWSNHFNHKRFQTNWVKPENIGTLYRLMNVEDITEKRFTQNLNKLLEVKAKK